jgi:hypothetical protein
MTEEDARDADGDAIDDNPDRGREHIEVLKETIDRNRDSDWERYGERYRFTVVGDGRVRVSAVDRESTPGRAMETTVDHVVSVEGGVAVGCNCFAARRRFDRQSCRHMRAVDAHPFI